MLRLRDIMTTSVVTVSPQTTLREAAELLAFRHLGGAPVVEGARVVGVVSASDILAFEVSTPAVPAAGEEPQEWDEWGEPPAWETGDEPAARYFTDLWADAGADTAERFAERATPEWDVLAEHTVAEVMTRQAYALPPTADVSAAADRMRTSGVHRVLVMEGGKLLGIVSTMDLARAVADHRITRRTYVFDSSPVERDHDRGAF
jgi:CBS domain-containing protein